MSSAPPGSPPGTPRWVKVSAIVAVVVALLLVALLLLGGENHGPGRHTSSDGGAQPSTVVEGHTPPAGGH
jgi:hypothetical protein